MLRKHGRYALSTLCNCIMTKREQLAALKVNSAPSLDKELQGKFTSLNNYKRQLDNVIIHSWITFLVPTCIAYVSHRKS